MNDIEYKRRKTLEIMVGSVGIGGNNPIRIQSMTNTDTMDTQATVEQTLRMVERGCEIVRITAPDTAAAQNLYNIKNELAKRGCNVPLVADIHFNPKAAEVPAQIVQKVRINPGNYTDRNHGKIDYTETEYNDELKKIADRLFPLIEICKKNHTAIRIGTNHGSLSERITSRYGNTAQGMAQSPMEFARICHSLDFDQLVLSQKSSNTRVMIASTRLLCDMLDSEGLSYPLHLGVTEAGSGEDGRIKSAVGIGTLLSDGLGDTIRVSLSESPVAEIPVAKKIVDFISRKSKAAIIAGFDENLYNPEQYSRRETLAVGSFGGNQVPLVLTAEETLPNGVLDCVLSSDNALGEGRLFFANLKSKNNKQPVVLTRVYNTSDLETLQIEASIELGPFFIDGLGDGIRIVAPNIAADIVNSLSYGILQATGARITKTEYISCPSCGRTLFDIESTIEKIKAATSHLKSLKIGIMGCVVNGPGEMADADYGYVGAGVGRVSLYRGQQCVEKNIPEEQAVEHLIALIRSDGRWV